MQNEDSIFGDTRMVEYDSDRSQLAFLCSELETKYPGVLAKLQSATSIREASDYVLIHFEAPYDQSESVKAQRAGYGSAYYYRYGQNTEN